MERSVLKLLTHHLTCPHGTCWGRQKRWCYSHFTNKKSLKRAGGWDNAVVVSVPDKSESTHPPTTYSVHEQCLGCWLWLSWTQQSCSGRAQVGSGSCAPLCPCRLPSCAVPQDLIGQKPGVLFWIHHFFSHTRMRWSPRLFVFSHAFSFFSGGQISLSVCLCLCVVT